MRASESECNGDYGSDVDVFTANLSPNNGWDDQVGSKISDEDGSMRMNHGRGEDGDRRSL